MWYAIHDSAGRLLSLGTSEPDKLDEGQSFVAVGEELPAGTWNPQALAFDAPVVVAAPLTRLQFLRRIPPERRIAIRNAAASDPLLTDALQLLDMAEEVRVDDPDTLRLVGYLQHRGLLGTAEAQALLQPEADQ